MAQVIPRESKPYGDISHYELRTNCWRVWIRKMTLKAWLQNDTCNTHRSIWRFPAMWHELFINRNSKIKNVVVCTRNQTIIGKFLIIHGHDSLPHPLKFLTAQHQTTTCYLLIVSFVVVVAQERSSSLEDAAGQIRRVQRGGVHHISTGLKSWTNFLLLSYPKTIWPTRTLKLCAAKWQMRICLA